VAAGEHQAQAVVYDRALLDARRVRRGFDPGKLREPSSAVGERAVAPQAIDSATPGGHGDPSAGVVGNSVARPRRDSRGERVLDCIFGELEVAYMADQSREYGGTLVAKGALDCGGRIARFRPPLAFGTHACASPRAAAAAIAA
jgi:hypothetical protein